MKMGDGEACPSKIDLFEVRGSLPKNPLNKPKNSPGKLKSALSS
jgi:hypothetical protein